jgi:class 3 adenylate cyclase
MTFDEILAHVLDLLQRQGRVSYRALKIRFQLDDDYLEGLKDELIDARQLAIDEAGKVLVWTGGASTMPAPLKDRGHALLSYTPTHLAEKIQTSRNALEGERKQVTVLFADLRGSMELLADRDPEEARQLLDPVLERMIEAVHRYEGTVNQVMGDGIMALFGAPIAHEDHAVRASYAALRMQETVTRYGDEMQRSHGVPVQIRIGLNSGAVVVRGIDSSLHMDYTAVGQTTHLASRMEQMAKPGSVLLDLQAAEFLYETRLFPELDYTFKHALTQQVAYESLLQERRRSLHAKIVETIEALYPDRMAERVEQLAHHALRGDVWDKAVMYGRQAGAKAYARGADREAKAYLEQALGTLQHLPESRATLEQAIDLRLDLQFAFVTLGELGSMLDHLRAAESLAETLHDQRRLGQVYYNMARYFWVMGDHDRAIAYGQRAVALAAALSDGSLQVSMNLELGMVYRTLGDYRRAMEYFGRNVASLADLTRERSSAGAPPIASLSYLVWCLAEMGEFPEGIARGEEGVRLAEVLGQPISLIFAYRGVGYLYLVKGDLHQAIPMLERGLALARDRPGYFPWISASLGYAYALAGRIAEAIPLLEEAVQRAASIGRVGQSLRLAYLSEAYLLAGRMESVLDLALRALTLAREHKEQGHEAYALQLLGEIAAQHDPPELESAEAYYGQALTLAEALGMRPLLAHCHLGLGTLYAKIGRREQARAELAAAIELFRWMEMHFWLTRAEAALAPVEGQ